MARHRILAALLCVTTAFAACSSGGGDDEQSSGGGDEQSSPTADPGRGERTFELASATYRSLAVEIPEQPVATAPAEFDGFSLDVYALQRDSAESVSLVFGLRNDSGDDRTFQREMEDPTVEGAVDYAISAVSLFDAVNLKRHLVFLDEENGCLCSRTDTVTVATGDTLYLAAQFPAPPADIESMTLQTPIGSVADVPLTDG